MLTRWRLTRGQREGMRALERPEERLRAVAAWDPHQAHHDVLQEAERCRPWVTLTIAVSLLAGATIGSAQPLMKVIDSLGGGGFP